MKFHQIKGLQSFLESQDSAVIAVNIDEKGSVHAAALRFVNDKNMHLFFVTSKNTEKMKMFDKKNEVKCACVIGTVKGVDFTLQMRGVLKISSSNNEKILDAYYKKRGNRHDNIDSPENVLLEFVPNWARYTDYRKGYDRFLIDLT